MKVRSSLPDYYPFVERIKKKGFEYLGTGSFRRVFKRGRVVIKVPINESGMLDNLAEHQAYHTYFNKATQQGILLAPCRLLPNGSLMMVALKLGVGRRPAWASSIDGHQVGRYKGRAVAYDYALDLVERLDWEEEWKRRNPRIKSFFHSQDWAGKRSFLEGIKQKQLKAG